MSNGNEPTRRTVRVTPGGDPACAYDVVIGAGVLDEAGSLCRTAIPEATRSFVAYDGAVPEDSRWSLFARLRGAGVAASGAGTSVDEDAKQFDTLEFLLEEMIREGLDRRDFVVALGGGVLGDLAGLAAALYKRGIRWVSCPTTLLAMVDASVGGKTGVNIAVRNGKGGYERRKNMAGVFWQPSLVIADVSMILTLPDIELRCGLAECVKHGMLSANWNDPSLLDWTESHATEFRRCDPGLLVELVARNVAVKAAIVGDDERETSGAAEGGRMALNLGHTFAHALESLPKLGLKHGEAVALGLIAACELGAKLGMCDSTLRVRIASLLSTIGLPVTAAGLPESTELVRIMRDDKKAAGGKLRLIVPTGPGSVRVVVDPALDAVCAGWDAIRA